MVFYRKYRPQTIEQLDSNQVRETLHAVLASKDPAHAFLFTGPKGLGKTSTARIVAKAINCTNKKKGSLEPCNTCDQCDSITKGAHVDIVEIDGASNRNIDDVRDLKEKITLSPATAKRKVYIIDEVHMFTTESFNALLKTLEEPPAHAMFILCTTERHKVPATIVSRCFTIDFQPATNDELVRSFTRIAKGEGLTVSNDAMEAIVALSDGGFRDGAKILEELAGSAVKGNITKDLVESRFKVNSTAKQVQRMVEFLDQKDMKGAITLVQETVELGIDVRSFTFQLLETLHRHLLQHAGITGEKNEAELQSKFSMETLTLLIELLSKAYLDMKHAVLPQLPLELAIIDWVTMHETGQQETTVIKTQVTKVQMNSGGVTVAGMRKQMGDLARVKALYGEPKEVKTKIDDIEDTGKPKINLMQIANDEITVEWMESFWSTFIAEMKQHNHTIAGVLRGCHIKGFDKKTLIIEAAYKFHKERLDEGKTREALETICKILTGNPVKVEVVLKT